MVVRRVATFVALLILVACTKGAPAAGGSDPARREEVKSAYLDAWAVRQDAVHRGDLSVIARRFTDEDPSAVVGNLAPGRPSAARIVSESVSARVREGLDVKGDIGHDITSIELSDDAIAAQVVDSITDRTFLVDRVTGVARSSEETVSYTETWFMARREGQWKVVYFAHTA